MTRAAACTAIPPMSRPLISISPVCRPARNGKPICLAAVSRAHPPWPTRGEGWGRSAVARGRVVRRRLGRPRCAGELVVEARRNDRPLRDRQHGGFGRRQVLVLRSCITLGQARQASVMAVSRQPSASTRRSECDAGWATARTAEGRADRGIFEPARCFSF
jgi:hypothetical protein